MGVDSFGGRLIRGSTHLNPYDNPKRQMGQVTGNRSGVPLWGSTHSGVDSFGGRLIRGSTHLNPYDNPQRQMGQVTGNRSGVPLWGSTHSGVDSFGGRLIRGLVASIIHCSLPIAHYEMLITHYLLLMASGRVLSEIRCLEFFGYGAFCLILPQVPRNGVSSSQVCTLWHRARAL